LNRDHKRKQYEKRATIKAHACHDTFICRVCGREVVPAGAGSEHRNHCSKLSF